MRQENHYPALDGLRGFAALAVVEFHMGRWLGAPSLTTNGYISVDLFFCLSGYVLPLAYGQRHKPDLSWTAFMHARVLRLLPLILLGTVVSAAYAGLRLHVQHEHGLYGAWALALILGLLVLPFLHAPSAIGGPQVFPLNGPQYTLFLEFLVNFLWFPIRRAAPLGAALALVAIAGTAIAIFGYGGDTTASFWLGLPRVVASFFAGVALFEIEQRFAVAKHLSRAFWPLFAVMVCLFAYPGKISLDVRLFWILCLSPLLVLSGLKVQMGPALRKLCLLGGELSYPIYVLQYPLFCWANGVFQEITHRKAPLPESVVIMAFVLAASYLLLRCYDAPIRRKLAPSRRPVRPAEAGGIIAPAAPQG